MNSFKKSWVILTSTLLLCLATMSMYFFHSLGDMKNLKDLENSPLKKEKILAQAFNFPLYFEKNEGQTDESVKYLTKGKGYTFYFTPESVVISLEKALNEDQSYLTALSMKFVGAKQDPLIKGIEEQIYKTNYFIGNEPSNWHTNVPNFEKVCYEEIYPGIDALFYGNKRQLEYDLCVAPGSNPKGIRLQLEGIKKLSLDSIGHLHIETEDDQEMLMQKPVVYQIQDGGKIFLEGNFVLLAHNEVGFALGDYDTTKELIIDPILEYSTYLGGIDIDLTSGIAVDSSGNAYVTGKTDSSNYPITVGAFQTFNSGGANDAFVTKMNSAGSGLLYSTYLGGSGDDEATGIAIDTAGDAYVVGFTDSTNYPVTVGAFQTSNHALSGNTSAFVTKLDSTGSLLIYSTYLGGTDGDGDTGAAIAVDSNGNAYVTGEVSSSDFPITTGAFQQILEGFTNAFLTKFDSVGNLVYSSYLGGSGRDVGAGITVDSNESAYLTGKTSSSDFPTAAGAFQTFYNGIVANAFVTKFNSVATGVVYSTYLGGSDEDEGNSIALDTSNHAYVTGLTSSPDFPITVGAFQTFKPTADGFSAFVTELNVQGSDLVYSTYLGGFSEVISSTLGFGIAVNSSGNAYVTGRTNTPDFPTTDNALQSTFSGLESAFITELNASGSSLLYSTLFGNNSSGAGIALGSNESFYVTGSVSSNDLPTTTGAFQTALPGATNSFIAKFELAIPTVTSISPNSGPTIGGTVVTITGTNFINVTSVSFGGVPAAFFIVNSPTQITAVSPPGTGIVDVTVTNADGTSAISPADQFTYINERLPTTTTLTVLPDPVGQPLAFVATIAPSIATGTVTFFDNGTVIGTAPVVNGTASFMTFLLTGSHTVSAVYSGDPRFLPSSASLAIHVPLLSVFPPNNLKGFEKSNKFATQTDIVNILTWKEPSQGNPPVAYRVYRNRELTHLIGVVSNRQKLQFVDHNRKKGKTYTYWVVSVDNFGNTSDPAVVTIHSKN